MKRSTLRALALLISLSLITDPCLAGLAQGFSTPALRLAPTIHINVFEQNALAGRAIYKHFAIAPLTKSFWTLLKDYIRPTRIWNAITVAPEIPSYSRNFVRGGVTALFISAIGWTFYTYGPQAGGAVLCLSIVILMALSSNGENKDPLNPRSMPKRMRRDLKTHDDVRNALRIIARSDFSLRFPTVEEIRQRVGRALWRQEKLELGEHLSHGGEHSVFRALGSIFSSPLVVRVQNPLQPLTSAPLTPDQWRERTRQATRAIMLLPGMNWDKPHPALPFVYQQGEADGVFYTLRDYVKGVPISDTHVRNAIQTRKDVPQAWAFLTVPLQLVAVLIYVREHHRHKRDFSDLHRNLLIGPAQDVHLIDLDDLVQNPDISLARNVSHEIYSVAQLLLGYLLDDSYVRHWNHWDPTQVDVLEKALIAENHFDPQNRQSIEIVARGIAPILRKMLVKPEQGQYTSLEDVFIDLANVGLQIARDRKSVV